MNISYMWWILTVAATRKNTKERFKTTKNHRAKKTFYISNNIPFSHCHLCILQFSHQKDIGHFKLQYALWYFIKWPMQCVVVRSDDAASVANVPTQSIALAAGTWFRQRGRRVDVFAAAELAEHRRQRQEEEIDCYCRRRVANRRI